MERSPHARLVMYSQDGLGLGHLRRTSAIANQLIHAHPDICVLTLADSLLGPFFKTAYNHDYLKLPSIVKVGPGSWDAANLALPFPQIHALRQELIRSAMISFQPHLLLVDHMPHGAMGELLPTLRALKASSAPTKVVLGLRDILDAPEIVQQRWQLEGGYAAIEQFYDRVLVYGTRDVFDVARQYQFPQTIVNRLQYCGYVCAPAVAGHTTRLRASYLAGTASETRLIVAMAGGGADAYTMMRALLDMLPAIQAQVPCVLVMIAGPFMPRPAWNDLRNAARGLPVHLHRSVSDTSRFMQAADLLVGMAGYNTTIEILRAGKPAILIPRDGPSAEQRMRARLFAERGWTRMIDPAELTADRVVQTVVDALLDSPGISAQDRPDLHGLEATVDQLLALLPLAQDQAETPIKPTQRAPELFAAPSELLAAETELLP